jgi:small redox-active disulfide protein 2
MKKIQILGSGCAKCRTLAKLTEAAAQELSLACDIEKVEDINRITEFGVMMTPALVVDGEVKVFGHVPSVEEIKKLIS